MCEPEEESTVGEGCSSVRAGRDTVAEERKRLERLRQLSRYNGEQRGVGKPRKNVFKEFEQVEVHLGPAGVL